MQYKDFCHEHLSKSVQQQEQQYSEANFEVNARLLKEYVAIGMVGIELSVLEPFTPSSESGTVMRANMAWLPKWGEVLVSLALCIDA